MMMTIGIQSITIWVVNGTLTLCNLPRRNNKEISREEEEGEEEGELISKEIAWRARETLRERGGE